MADYNVPDFTLPIWRALDTIPNFEPVYQMIHAAINERSLLSPTSERLRRADEQYTDYQQQENTVERLSANDRVFPLNTVELQRFNREHDTDLDKANIHIGYFADEYARSYNALALTLGYDIFFRNNAFNTSTEEGRKTLAHELSHVAQYKEGKINGNNSIDELEKEASYYEKQEEYDDDKPHLLRLGNKIYAIKKSEMNMIAEQLAENFTHRVFRQNHILPEKDFLNLLASYDSMLDERINHGIFNTR